jgi:methyl-accepting chemotaxis protein
MEDVGVTVRSMMSISEEVAGDVEHQRRETEEITGAIALAGDAVRNVATAIGAVSEDIEVTRKLSLDLNRRADEVDRNVTELTASLDRAVASAAGNEDSDADDDNDAETTIWHDDNLVVFPQTQQRGAA